MKNKELIKQLIEDYIGEEDDYFDAKESLIKDINDILLSYGDLRGVVSGTELAEIINSQLNLLGLGSITISTTL